MFMEIESPQRSSPSKSNISDSFHQSQWLQITVSDLHQKMKAMVTIIEGNSLDHRADIHKRKPELVEMLEDFSRSYQHLAETYDQLRSKQYHGFHSGSSPSSSNTQKTYSNSCNKTGRSQDKKMEAFTSHVNSVVEDSDIRCERANVDFEVLNKLEDQCYELMSVEPRNISFKAKREVKENVIVKIDGFELDQRIEDPPITSDELENMHSELKCEFTRLAEDNLKQLVELVTRNDEKRETIKKLQLQLEALKRENRALQISLRYSKANAKDNESHISRSGWLSISKLFRGCSH